MQEALETDTGIVEADFKGFPSIIDRLIATDLTVLLIQEDYNCGPEDAYRHAWLSEPYGEHEFPYNSECPVLLSLQGTDNQSVRREIMEME